MEASEPGPTAKAPSLDGFGLEDKLAELLDKGFLVIPDFISQEQVARVRRAFETEVRVLPMGGNLGDTSRSVVRGHNLLAKTRAVDDFILDPRFRALVEGAIGKDVTINIATLFNLLPGAPRQPLHADDGLWPIPRPHPHFLCNAVIAIDDFDEENGATHLVPYSHKWTRPVNQKEESFQVTMKSGSMLMWVGGMWHAGGANISRDRERLALFISHNVGYLRQQENQVLSVPRDVARQMPKKLQRLLGYKGGIWQIDFRDHVDFLRDGEVIHPAAKVAHPGWCKL